MARHSGFILSLALALTACDPGYGPDELMEEVEVDEGDEFDAQDDDQDEPEDGADGPSGDDADEPAGDGGGDGGDGGEPDGGEPDGGDGGEPDPGEPSDGGEPTPGDDGGESATVFESSIAPILLARCGCHTSGAPSAGLDLDSDVAYDVLVGAPSSAGLPYVTPGDPDASYLVHKIEGTQADVLGGGGSSMPPGGTIPVDELDIIVAWIADGAPN